MHSQNIVLFLREDDYHCLIKKYNLQEKINNLSIVFYISKTQINDENFTEEELFYLDYGTMFDILVY